MGISTEPARGRTLATCLLVIVGGGACAWAPDLHAQTRSLSLDRFDAGITVHPDATFLVEERLEVRFDGSFQGVFRDLLTRHGTAEGRRGRLRYEVEGATDAAGNPLRLEEERISGGRRLRIYVPDARDTVRTVILRYRVRGGLRFFDDGPDGPNHDELYWQVTGTGWEGPIRQASVRVRLPEGASGLHAWGYTGGPDSREQAVTMQSDGSEVEVVSRPLAAGEGLTISVIWDPGLVDRPGAVTRTAGAFRDNWPWGLPVVAFLVMWRVWTLRGRDPVRRAIMVQYDPPDDMSPAEVGTLVDHKAEIHDITATLVDLAVRGYLTIEEKESTGMLSRLSRTRDFSFHQRKPRTAWADLRAHERAYLEGLFPDPAEPLQSVDLSDLQNEFYKHLDGIRKKIYRRLKEKRYYERRPDHAPAPWIVLGVVVLMGGVGLTIASANHAWPWVPGVVPALVGTVLSAAIVLAFGAMMGVRTDAGVRALEQVLGFKEFLGRVEAPQYRRMITSPELFEKYLPFAMALQVEDRWARAFDGLYREPPDWYSGSVAGAGFQASAFTRTMSAMSTQASRTMSSSPGGSSGSGGGGSVGGGSGGGGGGGF